jgi:hypothetical protein
MTTVLPNQTYKHPLKPLLRLPLPGYSVGPVIGGALTSVNWRWVFGFQLPIGAVSMVLMFLLLRNHVKKAQPPRHAPPTANTNLGFPHNLTRIDWLGGFLFVAGGILLLMGLSWGSTSEWRSARVIACLVIGGLLLIVFIVWQAILGKRARNLETWTDPMIPLEIFKNYDVCATFFAAFTGGMVRFLFLGGEGTISFLTFVFSGHVLHVLLCSVSLLGPGFSANSRAILMNVFFLLGYSS